jgi:hypothetical protein
MRDHQAALDELMDSPLLDQLLADARTKVAVLEEGESLDDLSTRATEAEQMARDTAAELRAHLAQKLAARKEKVATVLRMAEIADRLLS